MAIEVTDLVGLSKPLTKFMDVVSKGIGTLYRPRAIRTEADARAYEVKTIARAEAEAAAETQQIQDTAAYDRVQLILRDQPELAVRARQRLLTREIDGQLNVEAILDCAADALPRTVSQEPVGSDWRRKFFLEAENVCEVDMQHLWGKVLAGEIAAPGAFALRTLDTLKHLSRTEAELFRLACAIAMDDGWIAIPGTDPNTSLTPFGLTYGDVLSLRDAGLVLAGDNLHRNFDSPVPSPVPVKQGRLLTNNGVEILFTSETPGSLQIPALPLTRAGKELQRLIEPNETPAYLNALGVFLRQKGYTAKRGTSSILSESSSVTTFEQDL